MSAASLFISSVFSSSAPSLASAPSSARVTCFCTVKTRHPVCQFCGKTAFFNRNCFRRSVQWKNLRIESSRKGPIIADCSNAEIATVDEPDTEEEESPSTLFEPAKESPPRRIAIFVEPSPFSYVFGYKNRFENFIRYLREMGDEVMVVTTHEGVPHEFYGAHLIGSRRKYRKCEFFVYTLCATCFLKDLYSLTF